MIIIKTTAELERMRASGHVAATVLAAVAGAVAPGTTTGDLDGYAAELIAAKGAKSAFYGYRGYPGHVCVSVNEEVVHGIPGKRRIAAGDIVSIDVGVEYQGFVGDTATTVMVGVADLEVARLVAATKEALEAAIRAAQAGRRLQDVSAAIEEVAVGAGFSVVREFVGHGVGRDLHEEPQIPNFRPSARGPVLKPGMTFALEPMVNKGISDVEVLSDGWTVVTRDRQPSAHFEHSVAVRADGPAEVLTC